MLAGERDEQKAGIQDDADGPGVDFEAMAVGSVEQNLGSDVIRSPANGSTAQSVTLKRDK